MLETIPDILSRIVQHKAEELAALRPHRDRLERKAHLLTGSKRDFAGALRSGRPAVIAEAKKASPSKGLLSPDFDPAKIARSYESGGAAAMSVLTDERFFQGTLDDMMAARAAVSIPVLRKDFTLEEVHVAEAAAAGADAILLIAAILSVTEMRRLREWATVFGMVSLVEVHNAEELSRALDSGAEILGVNNRNLHTFEVNLETSLCLAERIPSSFIRVSESGIHSRADLELLMGAGFHAFLVGEHLMKSGDPVGALRALTCS